MSDASDNTAAIGVSRDWPEDAKYENGMYSCQCVTCGEFFIGYKRRVVCKLCSVKGPSHEDTQ